VLVLSSDFILQFRLHDNEFIFKHSVFGEHYLNLIRDFWYQSFKISQILLAHLFNLAYFVLSFCHLQLQGIDCLSRLNQLAPQQSILIQKLPIQPFLLFIHSFVIGGKLLMDGLPARIEHSALRRELSTGHFQAFLGFFIRGYSLVGVPAARAPALRIGSFGEGVVVVLAQGRTAFLFGEICQIFVSGLKVSLWLVGFEVVGHWTLLLICPLTNNIGYLFSKQ